MQLTNLSAHTRETRARTLLATIYCTALSLQKWHAGTSLYQL